MELEVMVLSEKEKEMILKERAKAARQAELDKQFVILRNTLDQIQKLGGSVVVDAVGGKYVHYHNPAVNNNTVHCRYSRWG